MKEPSAHALTKFMQPPHRVLETATIYDSYLVTALCLPRSFRVWIMYDKMPGDTDKEDMGKQLWEGFFEGGKHLKVQHVAWNHLGNTTRCGSNSCVTRTTHRITRTHLVIVDGGEQRADQCSLLQSLIKTSFSASCHRKETNLLRTWAWSVKNDEVVHIGGWGGFWRGKLNFNLGEVRSLELVWLWPRLSLWRCATHFSFPQLVHEPGIKDSSRVVCARDRLHLF